MTERKRIIEEIMACLNATKNKMQFKVMAQGHKGRITHSQWFVLSMIEANKDMGIKDISNMLSITSSAATQLVDGLMKSGYVVRKTNKQDHRFLDINLSSKGQKIIGITRKKHLQSMETIFNSLSHNELKTYLSLQKKILNNILHKNEN